MRMEMNTGVLQALLLFLNFMRGCVPQCSSFTCRDGQCTTHIFDRCSGQLDCADGSDEANCEGCSSGFFCDNGECTSLISDRCNTLCDCEDCSDELNCFPFVPGTLANSSSEADGVGRLSTSVIIGIIVGSVGGFLLVFCLPLTFLVVTIAVVVGVAGRRKARGRREEEEMKTEAVPTSYLHPGHEYSTLEEEEPNS